MISSPTILPFRLSLRQIPAFCSSRIENAAARDARWLLLIIRQARLSAYDFFMRVRLISFFICNE